MSNSHHHHKALPKRIILVRHGESQGNLDGSAYVTTPDHKIPLTTQGLAQARFAGENLRGVVSASAVGRRWKVYFYVSPYERTRSTLREIGRSFSRKRVIGVREECRVREQDFGNFQEEEKMKDIKETREKFGRFFYRFPEGESAADVYDRVSSLGLVAWGVFKFSTDESMIIGCMGRVQVSHSDAEVTLLHFEDEPRHGVFDVIAALVKQGNLRTIMLTGDHDASAQRTANAVGIHEVYCNLKPEEKLNYVKRISRDAGGGLVMVGDGINDAPALASATVGIVLAQHASATAIAAADVLLLQDSIYGVPFCIAKSRQTTSLVKQNVALALFCIVMAALPSVLGFLPLWLTVLLHEGGTLVVCVNSVRALSDPTWSWRQDIQQVVDKVVILTQKFCSRTKSNTIQAQPL